MQSIKESVKRIQQLGQELYKLEGESFESKLVELEAEVERFWYLKIIDEENS